MYTTESFFTSTNYLQLVLDNLADLNKPIVLTKMGLCVGSKEKDLKEIDFKYYRRAELVATKVNKDGKFYIAPHSFYVGKFFKKNEINKINLCLYNGDGNLLCWFPVDVFPKNISKEIYTSPMVSFKPEDFFN
jgi:hypothetical protein